MLGLPACGHLEGTTVHYVAYNGRHLAAFIIGLNGDIGGETITADLAVFTNMENVAGKKNFGTQFHSEVRYSITDAPGTWHWIEQSTSHENRATTVNTWGRTTPLKPAPYGEMARIHEHR